MMNGFNEMSIDTIIALNESAGMEFVCEDGAIVAAYLPEEQ